MKTLSLGAVALALAAFASVLQAQAWPSQPVKVIVPFPPGGGTDLTARSVAARLATTLGQPFVVENRGGAGGTIGADAVAKSAPDGYTIGIATSSTHPGALVLQKNVPYDPLKSFAPITMIGSTSFVLLANPTLPANTLAELVAYARANPGKLNFANVGTSTIGYLLTLQLKALTGTSMVDIGYKGASQAYPDVIGNQVSLFLDNPGASTPLVTSGRLKAYAVTTPTPSLPGVPLFSEAGASVGLRNFDASFWYGLVAPAGTPRAVVDRIQAETAKFVHSPEGRKEFAARSLEPVGSTPDQFAAAMQKDVERYSALARQLGIQPQ
jgi:tripartite-type tricarboxylate transporter receptor subunit TctC